MTTIKAWHFLVEPKLSNCDNRPVVPGETLEVEGEIVPCENGLHGSERPKDALKYAPRGSVFVQRTEHSGEIKHHDGDKLVSSRRKCLWIANCENALRKFAVWCRWRQVGHKLRDREPSLAVLWALDCADRYLDGEADRDELDAAAYAAIYADAAADADAAIYAAYAAYAAAYDAAYAAHAAAAASAAAAAVAERTLQNEVLTEMLEELAP